MTKEEKAKRIKDLEDQINYLKNGRESWVDIGETYYCSGMTGYGFEDTFDDDEVDIDTITFSDCFRTKEEQNAYSDYKNAIMRLKNWIREHNEGWKPDFNGGLNKYYVFRKYIEKSEVYTLDWNAAYDTQTQPLWFYLKNSDLVNQCIEEMHDDLMTYFNYNNFNWLEVPKEEEA